MQATVREIQHQVRINLTDAPLLTDALGRKRRPLGLRLSYGRSSVFDRVDIVVEYGDGTQLHPPVADVPQWLQQLVDEHRPDGPVCTLT